MGSLGHVEAEDLLDTFHSDHLQPDGDFLWRARKEIGRICEFLKARCFQDAPGGGEIKVLKVVKGGSLGKGTAMKNGSDADLVLFLNVFQSYADQEEDRKTIIEEIARQLRKWKKEPYFSQVDLGQLLDLLEDYRNQEEDPREIAREIAVWLRECQEELRLSTADLTQFFYIFKRFTNRENDQKMLLEEMARSQGQRYFSDGDLWWLLDLTRRYTNKETQQEKIFQEVERWFNKCKENMRLELIFEQSKWPNPRVLQFKLRSKESVDFIEFDVLPAYDALGQYQRSKPDPQIYVDLIRTGKSGEFSPCFTELQKDFIVDRPTKLKNLIRLVKHWYNEVKGKKTSLPPKYALELLTVYAWEQGSGQTKFDTAEGFRTVLWLIDNYKEIRIYWTTYYDFDNEIVKRYLQKQLRKNRPVILDPADPTANFGEAEGWGQLAEKARSYADMNCFRKRNGSLVEPWKVPADSARFQMFDPDQLKVESAFHPSELAEEVPWGEKRCSCTLL